MQIVKIGLPCTPSKNISHDEFKCKRILVTYGGGMGGANKKYYATKVVTGAFWGLTLIDGNKVEVNPDFIVDIEEIRVVKLVTDITAWSNHANHGEKKVKKSIKTEYFVLEYGEEAQIIKTDYTARHESNLKDRVCKQFTTTE